jgi:hypothetical protein
VCLGTTYLDQYASFGKYDSFCFFLSALWCRLVRFTTEECQLIQALGHIHHNGWDAGNGGRVGCPRPVPKAHWGRQSEERHLLLPAFLMILKKSSHFISLSFFLSPCIPLPDLAMVELNLCHSTRFHAQARRAARHRLE